MLSILSPRFSFIRFESEVLVQSCNFPSASLCLPVYLASDIAFQFVLQADTEEEADALCDLDNNLVQFGIANSCDEALILDFQEAGYRPERYRIGTTQVLYNWSHGLPGFDTVIDVGECFLLKVIANAQVFCSNCFQRIAQPCHTSVIEYGNDENAYGFNYCSDAGAIVDGDTPDCEPLFIPFTNVPALVINYTAQLQEQYGSLPNVQVWLYDENGDLLNQSVSVKFDSYPPSVISIDMGGNGSGVVKIS